MFRGRRSSSISIVELRKERQRSYETAFDLFDGALQEAGCVKSSGALYFTRELHPGLRKDDITPAHTHLMEVGEKLFDLRVMAVAAGLDTDKLVALALLHDTPEEYLDIETPAQARLMREQFNGDISVMRQAMIQRFGEDITDGAFRLSRDRPGGISLGHEAYYRDLAQDPYLLIVKLADRAHNWRHIYGLLSTYGPVNSLENTNLLLECAEEAQVNFPAAVPLIHILCMDIKGSIETALGFYRGIGSHKLATLVDTARAFKREHTHRPGYSRRPGRVPGLDEPG